jgi:AcrR family transcriptional regulator
MPKLIEHPARREFLVSVTWRVIVAEGLGAVTLRRVAAEAGFANGAIKPYFRSKAELMVAAYQMAFDRTAARASESVADRTGLEALRRLCQEIMPLDDERRVEARVVIAFWEAAVGDDRIATVFRDTVASFYSQLGRHLREARAAGEVSTTEPDDAIVDELMWMLMGLQSLCWLMPDHTAPARQAAVLDRFLETLGSGSGSGSGAGAG